MRTITTHGKALDALPALPKGSHWQLDMSAKPSDEKCTIIHQLKNNHVVAHWRYRLIPD